MLRFPNPGSTIENFVGVYSAAFERLNGQSVDLDDIVDAVVRANLATSSGYMGDEAVARSTRADRSRDIRCHDTPASPKKFCEVKLVQVARDPRASCESRIGGTACHSTY